MFVAYQLYKRTIAKDPKNLWARAVYLTLAACFNSTVTTGAMVQAFKNWAQKHPADWSTLAHDGVFDAIKETWPCPDD